MTLEERLSAAMAEMERAPEVVRPTAFWADLNRQHAARLAETGIGNFRRTLARDYFTWMRVLPWDSQIRFLVRQLPPARVLGAIAGTFRPLKHAHVGLAESWAMTFLTRLVWAYAEQQVPEIAAIPECDFGNPPGVFRNGRLISQDLANSVLEVQSYKDVARGTICELGGGYGRNAYAAGKLLSVDRYILADLPPAIVVAESFLRAAYPDKRHFALRPFDDFEAVREELEASDFVYLYPHQLAHLPDGYVDLFLNISSLHEMRLEQVRHYMGEIHRLVRPGGHFYLKAWDSSNNKSPEFQINAGDYDFGRWEEVFWRTPPVQTRFFETVQRKPG